MAAFSATARLFNHYVRRVLAGMSASISSERISLTRRKTAFDLTTRYLQSLRTHWRNWCEARSRYATKRALNKIDDRMLKDIGVQRNQVESRR
jgi:uncharacterized protein YjiS (DUF1127 family)